MGYEIEGDWFSLPKPWAELPDHMREKVVASAGEIHTYDKGMLRKANGLWEVVHCGDHNDADVILNVLRKPN